MQNNKNFRIFTVLIILITITGCGAAIETSSDTAVTTSSDTTQSNTTDTTVSSDTTALSDTAPSNTTDTNASETTQANNTITDTTAPTILSITPTSNATAIGLNSAVTVAFSEIIDTSTITNSSFTLSDGTESIAGMVTYAGTTATFTPSGNMNTNTTYTANISTGVKDLAGNAMEGSYTWSFKTVSAILSWSAPTTRMDGSLLPAAEIGGYKVYYGTSSGNYTSVEVLSDTTYTFNNLPAGTYFFALTSYDTSVPAYESDYSNEVSKAIK